MLYCPEVNLQRSNLPKGQALFAALLIVIIVGLAVTIGLNLRQPAPLEINLEPARDYEWQVYVGGAVANPGDYPMSASDTVEEIIAAAGGITGDATTAEVSITVDRADNSPQRVNLNTAEPWLLQALPGIGETRARAIADYRVEHGPFQNVRELLRVPGLSQGTLNAVSEYVTVRD